MILAVDVDYRDDGSAVAAGALFADWRSPSIAAMRTVRVPAAAPYRPGRFFERELPCILALMDSLDILPETIVIDGYVTLGPDAADGLGAHLHRALGGRAAVIGVAKTRYRGTPVETEVLRGRSLKPLHVTAMGIAPAEARSLVRTMAGGNRLPSILAAVDRACRAA